MLEHAAASLDAYLKANIDQIKQNTENVNILRKKWLGLYPEYREYDLQLDVEWTGLSGRSNLQNLCWCCPPPKGPHARGFRVFTRDWQDERHISRKIGELRCSRQDVDDMKESLMWDQ